MSNFLEDPSIENRILSLNVDFCIDILLALETAFSIRDVYI